jgi:hypothetical protein
MNIDEMAKCVWNVECIQDGTAGCTIIVFPIWERGVGRPKGIGLGNSCGNLRGLIRRLMSLFVRGRTWPLENTPSLVLTNDISLLYPMHGVLPALVTMNRIIDLVKTVGQVFKKNCP